MAVRHDLNGLNLTPKELTEKPQIEVCANRRFSFLTHLQQTEDVCSVSKHVATRRAFMSSDDAREQI